MTKCVFQPLAVRPFRFCLSFLVRVHYFSGWYSANEGAVKPGHFCPRCDPSAGCFLSRAGAWGQFLLGRSPSEPWGAALLLFEVRYENAARSGLQQDLDVSCISLQKYTRCPVKWYSWQTASSYPVPSQTSSAFLRLPLFSGQLYLNLEQAGSRAELVPQPGTALMGNLGLP